MKSLSDLTTADFKTIESHAVDYLNELDQARQAGHANPETVARGPKLRAYGELLNLGFTAEEAIEAFTEMCGNVDGVTA